MIISSKCAQSKYDRCVSHAHETAASAQTSTGPVRGAVWGMVHEAVLGNARPGAGVGVIVGTTPRANRNRYFYNQWTAS
jgi:hypothetical protein